MATQQSSSPSDERENSENNAIDFPHVPDNVLDCIFSKIDDPRSLARLEGVCCSWQNAVARRPWRRQYLSLWPNYTHRSNEKRWNRAHLGEVVRESAFGASESSATWRRRFCARMLLSRSLGSGRPSIDRLIGHHAGVKVAKIVPEYNVLLTGSVDRRLIQWDLENGKQLAASSQHAGTIRCLAMDDGLLATGSSDKHIRVWRREDHGKDETQFEDDDTRDGKDDADDCICDDGLQDTTVSGSAHQACSTWYGGNVKYDRTDRFVKQEKSVSSFPFRIQGERAVVQGGHAGPVSAFALTPMALFSGSWDYTVRVWGRRHSHDGYEDDFGDNGTLESGNGIPATPEGWPLSACLQVLHFDDWISAMAVQESTLFVAAGQEVHVVDIETSASPRTIDTSDAIGKRALDVSPYSSDSFEGLRPLYSIRKHETPAAITALQVSTDGSLLFYGTGEGGVYAVDLREPQRRPHNFIDTSANLASISNNMKSIHATRKGHLDRRHGVGRHDRWSGYACSSAVTGLSWDFPWLAASLQNGEVVLLDAEQFYYDRDTSAAARAGSARSFGHGEVSEIGTHSLSNTASWRPSRALSVGHGVAGGSQCVDICERWLVSGYENGAVVTWDFEKAREAAETARMMREMRRKARERKKQQHYSREVLQRSLKESRGNEIDGDTILKRGVDTLQTHEMGDPSNAKGSSGAEDRDRLVVRHPSPNQNEDGGDANSSSNGCTEGFMRFVVPFSSEKDHTSGHEESSSGYGSDADDAQDIEDELANHKVCEMFEDRFNMPVSMDDRMDLPGPVVRASRNRMTRTQSLRIRATLLHGGSSSDIAEMSSRREGSWTVLGSIPPRGSASRMSDGGYGSGSSV